MNKKEIYEKILELPDNKLHFFEEFLYNSKEYFGSGYADIDNKRYVFFWNHNEDIIEDTIEEEK